MTRRKRLQRDYKISMSGSIKMLVVNNLILQKEIEFFGALFVLPATTFPLSVSLSGGGGRELLTS